MKSNIALRKVHTVVGLILLLPFLGWVLTGAVFLFKPGYDGAYEKINLKFYPVEHRNISLPENAWLEIRLLKTVLGEHLLVKSDGEWQQLNTATFELRAKPSEQAQRQLLMEAISQNHERYGSLERREGDVFITSTGVELRLNWNTLTVHQMGNDTKLIKLLYKIHYLQWLGHEGANKVMGISGLFLLLVLALYGLLLYLRKRRILKFLK